MPVFRSPDQAAVAVFFMGRLLHQGKGRRPPRRCAVAAKPGSHVTATGRGPASRCNRKPAPLHRHRVRARRCACQQARAPSHWPRTITYRCGIKMLVIDTEQTRGALSFEQAIPALREAFAQGAHVPARHVHAIDSGGAHGTSLIMPAWNERGYFGVKVINIFPRTRASRCRACTRPITCTAPAAACRWRRSTATSSRCSAPPARRRWALRTWRGRTPPCC